MSETLSGQKGLQRDWRSGVARLAIGLVQGLVMAALIHDTTDPRLDHMFSGAAWLVTLFVPPIWLAGLTRWRRTPLAIWSGSAASVLAALGAYGQWRATDASGVPDPSLLALSASSVFIVHHLIDASLQDGKVWASYRTRFEGVWRSGLQLALSLAFTGAFLLLLQLGASMFALIGINGLKQLMSTHWFVLPAMGAAFASAVHLTDIRQGLVRAVQGICLTLLTWLLPLACLLCVAFLVALPFTGLTPLWKTGQTTSLLLAAAAMLTFLINAAFRDGDAWEETPRLIRIVARVAAAALVPLAGLAGYAVGLRIVQHGLTPERLEAACAVAVAAVAAGGYFWAAVDRRTWFRRLETVNVAVAIVGVVIALATLSPLGDPARLSVADQVRRLNGGATAPASFDFHFLRFGSGRFGLAALRRLASAPDRQIRARAAAALKATRDDVDTMAPDSRAFANATVHPAGIALPETFRHQVWGARSSAPSPCLSGPSACDIYLLDLTGDKAPEVLVRTGMTLVVYKYEAGTWTSLAEAEACDSGGKTLDASVLPQAVEPLSKDLSINGVRLRMRPIPYYNPVLEPEGG